MDMDISQKAFIKLLERYAVVSDLPAVVIRYDQAKA